jgi:hypothetical protein
MRQPKINFNTATPSIKWQLKLKSSPSDGTDGASCEQIVIRKVSVLVIVLLAILAFTATPALASAPMVELNQVAQVAPSETTATVHVEVNPGGLDTHVYIEYGPERDTEKVDALPTSGDVSVTLVMYGLQPGEQYRFHVVAVNAEGTVTGREHEFTTQSPAGLSPWWHVLSSTRPTYLQPLHLKGVDEVQDLTVTGVVGEEFESRYILYNKPESAGGVGEVFFVGYDAATFQTHLEGVYGAGSVEVKGGPGALVVPGEHNTSTYEITFKGSSLGERPVEPIDVEESKNDGFEPVLTVTQKTAGQLGKPDGLLAATVTDIGDTGVNECVRVPSGKGAYRDSACSEAAEPGHEEYEKSPVRIVDKLPPGVTAVSAEGVIGEGKNLEPLQSCPRTEGQEVECVVTGAGIRQGLYGNIPWSVVPAFNQVELRIHVVVNPGAQVAGAGEPPRETEVNELSVSGGDAAPARLSRPLKLSSAPVPAGVENFELTPENVGGGVDTQAGSHPFQTTFTTVLNQSAETLSTAGHPVGHPAGLERDLRYELPPGLIGNPQPFARCTAQQLLAKINECPVGSIVGVAITTIGEPQTLGLITFTTPLFNMEPSVGEPAKFAFIPENAETPVYIDTRIRTGGDYGIVAEVRNITQEVDFLSNETVFWGVPGNGEHNETRGGCLVALRTEHGHYQPCEAVSEKTPPPFFELPTACPVDPGTGEPVPLRSRVEGDSWEAPGNFLTGANIFTTAAGIAGGPLPAMDGCDKLPFAPTLTVTPDVQDASSSSGLDVDVKVPQEESLNANGLGEADLRNTTVALPAGVAINPSGGDGLQACTSELAGLAALSPPRLGSPGDQIGYEGSEEPALEPGVTVPKFSPQLPGSVATRETSEATLQPGINFCSTASKIGTARIKTPLLKKDLEGAVYLAPQEANPFGSLLAMYIVAEDPESGVLLKLPGEVQLCKGAGEVIDGQTCQGLGQIITTFLNTPQAPAEEIELHFFGGEKAPLATPSRCGSYTTTTSIVPWSAPQSGPPATPSSTFNITSGPNGGPCPGAQLPFNPYVTGGSLNLQAGEFTPLTVTMSRKDGEQNLKSLVAKLPPGLSGVLTGVELCPEPQANLGECGENSKIGEATVAVGVGGHPFTVSGGRFYLTGPYNGSGACTVGQPGCAPFGITFEVPAKAGPFDLAKTQHNHPACDCVLVRGKIELNPLTAAITITSDPPGSPYSIPTSLEGIPLEIQKVNATTTRGNFQFNPTNCAKMSLEGTVQLNEGGSDTITTPFQATNCAALKFEPKFSVSTSGKTSKANGASLTAKVTYPNVPQGTDADIAKVKVELPLQLPSRLTTLQKACTNAQFEANPAACPAASKIGYAVVHTPLIPVPLEGPAIFVSHGGEAFPSLTMVLQGYGITIDLVGTTFISKSGVTSTTFKTVPDQPFSTFELTLPEGKFSALAANGNLCKPTTTKTVSKKVKVKVKGREKTVTSKVKEQVAASLAMPTEFVAQNGAEIHQTTPIRVIGCPPTRGKAHKAVKVKKHKKVAKGKKG